MPDSDDTQTNDLELCISNSRNESIDYLLRCMILLGQTIQDRRERQYFASRSRSVAAPAGTPIN